MNSPIGFDITVLLPGKSAKRASFRCGFPVVPLALALGLFALSQTALGVTPAPDGVYPGNNTAEGDNALFSLTTGADNTANGLQALYSNTTGNDNTANGVNALFFNTTANDNTATGFEALYSNTTGADNTANGVNALLSNTTGSQNTANGVGTLKQNTTGHTNTANGYRALYINTTGNNNTANGLQSLYSNTTGSQNTAEGLNALANNTIGSNNVALGVSAGSNLTTGNNNIEIGAAGVAAEANTIRIGKSGTQQKTFIAGISGMTVASGVGVIINANGQMGTVQSSARFKQDIKPMAQSSEAVLKLKPVTFRYQRDLDPDGIPQFGLVAEEVEKVNPDLVARDDKGKPYTVRYEAVNAMLLNEFLKEHRNVAQQESTIAELKTTVAQQQKQIEALAATVQKVSNQLELNKAAQQVVASNQ